jgi:hypothetical protein
VKTSLWFDAVTLGLTPVLALAAYLSSAHIEPTRGEAQRHVAALEDSRDARCANDAQREPNDKNVNASCY